MQKMMDKVHKSANESASRFGFFFLNLIIFSTFSKHSPPPLRCVFSIVFYEYKLIYQKKNISFSQLDSKNKQKIMTTQTCVTCMYIIWLQSL